MELRCPHGINGPFTISNDPWSRSSWSPWPKRPIYKVKRSPEKLWRQFVTMAKMTHLLGQTSTRTGTPPPPILPIFECYSLRDFMVIQNSDVIFAKYLDGPLLRPYL
ncbi:hypothetical protein H5410_049326 [Solanum commersonii]|uniref:Uncharacterized protein n=1 Tax=Solanum commersonii TaxID=4109 RepID=A0A9J5WS02_SOLCO|nr:hypothetical protein H5410_049326 [Solanum commersonii]